MGPRNCIGKNLAYAEMRLVLARVIYNFDIEFEPGIEKRVEKIPVFNLYEKPPLWVKMSLAGH